MERKFNFKLLANAKNLRRNMTKEERRLWYNFLSNYSEKFVRQKIIGNYIADVFENINDDNKIAEVKSKVKELCAAYPLYKGRLY